VSLVAADAVVADAAGGAWLVEQAAIDKMSGRIGRR
jgi:hypothetical protein